MPLPGIEELLLCSVKERRDSIIGEKMDVTNMLNTNARQHPDHPRPHHQAMQYEVPIPINLQHDMSSTPQYPHQTLYVPTPNGNGHHRIKSENGSERGVSPHTSEHSSRYSSQTPNTLGFQQMASQLANGMRYPSPSQLQQQQQMPLIQHSYHPNPPQDPNYAQQVPQMNTVSGAVQDVQEASSHGGRVSTSGLPKAFACSTCAKGFARRSDLARHERIHSGVRPHVCDHPGCGKQFIQRSALTVHSRVHTGEKPHMCERCGKPFSDSSSLARHRRIHSGKRPYKCPYADCQKTFTRRTTLTRHQNHHTGTIEEAEAATAAALASRVSLQTRGSRGSDEEDGGYSDGKSPMPQPSPHDRGVSVPPAAGMNGISQLNRQNSDYYMTAMQNGMGNAAVPAHLRSEMGQTTPRSSSPAQYPIQVNGQSHRPALTSNPSNGSYGPPQTLEPPTTNGQQQQGGSAGGSPHMGAMGWQSPHPQQMQGQTDYSYPDPNTQYVQSANTMYYQQAQSMQRPHSTGPLDYQQHLRGPEGMWAQHQ